MGFTTSPGRVFLPNSLGEESADSGAEFLSPQPNLRIRGADRQAAVEKRNGLIASGRGCQQIRQSKQGVGVDGMLGVLHGLWRRLGRRGAISPEQLGA